MAAIQAQAFHRPHAFAPLDTLLYYAFQARIPLAVTANVVPEAHLPCSPGPLWSQPLQRPTLVLHLAGRAAQRTPSLFA